MKWQGLVGLIPISPGQHGQLFWCLHSSPAISASHRPFLMDNWIQSNHCWTEPHQSLSVCGAMNEPEKSFSQLWPLIKPEPPLCKALSSSLISVLAPCLRPLPTLYSYSPVNWWKKNRIYKSGRMRLFVNKPHLVEPLDISQRRYLV